MPWWPALAEMPRVGKAAGRGRAGGRRRGDRCRNSGAPRARPPSDASDWHALGTEHAPDPAHAGSYHLLGTTFKVSTYLIHVPTYPPCRALQRFAGPRSALQDRAARRLVGSGEPMRGCGTDSGESSLRCRPAGWLGNRIWQRELCARGPDTREMTRPGHAVQRLQRCRRRSRRCAPAPDRRESRRDCTSPARH